MKKYIFIFIVIVIAILIFLTKKTQSIIFSDVEQTGIEILKRDTIKLKGVYLKSIRLGTRERIAEIKILNSNYKCYDKRHIDKNNYYGIIYKDTARFVSNTVFKFDKGDTVSFNIEFWNKDSFGSLKTYSSEFYSNFLFEYQLFLNDYYNNKYGKECLCD